MWTVFGIVPVENEIRLRQVRFGTRSIKAFASCLREF